MNQPADTLYANELPEEAVQQLRVQARDFLDTLIEHPINSPGFQKNLGLAHSLGSSLSEELSYVFNHTVSKEQKKLDKEVAEAMEALNALVRELTPSPKNTLLSVFTGKKEFQYEKYFTQYQNSQESIRTVIRGLMASQDSLMRENGRLIEEKKHIYELYNKVHEHEKFVEVFIEQLSEQMKETKGKYDAAYLDKYFNEVQLVFNQKRQDFLTLKTVTMQSYLALDITYSNNETLKDNLEHARTVTMYALQTAYQVAQSVVSQKEMLVQIESMKHEAEQGLVTLGNQVNPQGQSKEDALRSLNFMLGKVTNAIGQYQTTMEKKEQETYNAS